MILRGRCRCQTSLSQTWHTVNRLLQLCTEHSTVDNWTPPAFGVAAQSKLLQHCLGHGGASHGYRDSRASQVMKKCCQMGWAEITHGHFGFSLTCLSKLTENDSDDDTILVRLAKCPVQHRLNGFEASRFKSHAVFNKLIKP